MEQRNICDIGGHVPFDKSKITSIEIYNGSCRVFQKNGYHFRIDFKALPAFLKTTSFSPYVRFIGFGTVINAVFDESHFWKTSLQNTTNVYIHGRWEATAVLKLLKLVPSLSKICFTYWKCYEMDVILDKLNCRDIVVDLRGIDKNNTIGVMDKTVATLMKLPTNLSSLVIIFEEHFHVEQFIIFQRIISAKMKSGSQAVTLFDGESDCLKFEILDEGGRMHGFRFTEAEPCHIASYTPCLEMYNSKKNMDAFSIFFKTYKDISFIVGAKITVTDSTGNSFVDDGEYPISRYVDVLTCSSTIAMEQLHIEVEHVDENPARGRTVLPQSEIVYSAPQSLKPCCQIKNIVDYYKNLKGLRYSYGIPIFRKRRYLSVLHEKSKNLLEKEERVLDTVYFENHVELHLDNGLISRPDADEAFILRHVRAAECLIVHSQSSKRFAIEATSLFEHLQFVKWIEFRGPWWGRLIYQYVFRFPPTLQKFIAVCFQSQRTGLADLWQHHRIMHDSYVSAQLTHLAFDARDCRLDNLYDVLRALYEDPGRSRCQNPFVPYRKLFLIVPKVCGPNIMDSDRFNFEMVVNIFLRYTDAGSSISMALMNALPPEERSAFNYFGESDFVNGILKMKCIGKTIIPQVQHKCGIRVPDLSLKLFYSKYKDRFWHFAIPFDCP